jgi:hypothetical protein
MARKWENQAGMTIRFSRGWVGSSWTISPGLESAVSYGGPIAVNVNVPVVYGFEGLIGTPIRMFAASLLDRKTVWGELK